MTTSGVSTFNLDNGSILVEAFDRCEIRPVEITREYLASGIRSLNLELQSWNNMPVNLFKIELITFPLVQGTATYTFDPSVQLVTDAYVTQIQGGNQPIDRILVSISRDAYSEYPNKTQQGAQSVYWFSRLETPTITLYPVPDGVSENYLNCYVMKRIQDANLANGQTADIPIRFLDALCAKVAARLAMKYKAAKYPLLKQEANEAYMTAFIEDQERVMLSISPDFSIYDPH